jgi:uncharacterized DUF497 family protein
MKIDGIIWLRGIADKLEFKHNVTMEEAEEALGNKPKSRFVEKGERKGEDVYMALGRADSGRHLSVLFIYKRTREALILSARDMAYKERKQYGKK